MPYCFTRNKLYAIIYRNKLAYSQAFDRQRLHLCHPSHRHKLFLLCYLWLFEHVLQQTGYHGPKIFQNLQIENVEFTFKRFLTMYHKNSSLKKIETTHVGLLLALLACLCPSFAPYSIVKGNIVFDVSLLFVLYGLMLHKNQIQTAFIWTVSCSRRTKMKIQWITILMKISRH